MVIIRDLSSKIINILKSYKKMTLKSLADILEVDYNNFVQSIDILEMKNIIIITRLNKRLYISLNQKLIIL